MPGGKIKLRHYHLLIRNAENHRLRPVYCLYASEIKRAIWQKRFPSGGLNEFEYGCLLASAHKVKAKMPKTLTTIEAECVPWHYLVDRQRYSEQKLASFIGDDTAVSFSTTRRTLSVMRASDDSAVPLDEFPTIDELNAVDRPKMALEGVVEKESLDYHRQVPDGTYLERGISRLTELDVRDVTPRRRPDV